MRRLLPPSIAILLTSFAAAQGYLGSKTAGATTVAAADSGSAGTFLQMLVALAVVVALLKVALPKFAGKLGSKLTTSVNGTLKVEESASFAGGTLYVVRARAKTLLLGVNGSNVVCLADISEAPGPERAPVTFQEMVQEQSRHPETESYKAVAHVPIDPEMEAAEQLLERLTRLGA